MTSRASKNFEEQSGHVLTCHVVAHKNASLGDIRRSHCAKKYSFLISHKVTMRWEDHCSVQQEA